jgi:hypothetical protein
METLMAMPPVLAAVVGLLLLAWIVLLILIPFIVEGIRTWTRKNHEELRALNQKIERLTAALETRRDSMPQYPTRSPAENASGPRGAARRQPAVAPRPPAARQEPTLSEFPAETGPERRPTRT